MIKNLLYFLFWFHSGESTINNVGPQNRGARGKCPARPDACSGTGYLPRILNDYLILYFSNLFLKYIQKMLKQAISNTVLFLNESIFSNNLFTYLFDYFSNKNYLHHPSQDV